MACNMKRPRESRRQSMRSMRRPFPLELRTGGNMWNALGSRTERQWRMEERMMMMEVEVEERDGKNVNTFDRMARPGCCRFLLVRGQVGVGVAEVL